MSAPPDETLLDVRGLTVDFIQATRPPARVLHNVGFTLRRSEILGVVGESGCGKTTLMLALMGLLPAAARIMSGSVLYRDQEILGLDEKSLNETIRWRRMSMVFQSAMNALNPVRTVGVQIQEPIIRHTGRASDALRPDLPLDRQLATAVAASSHLNDSTKSNRATNGEVAHLLDLVGIHPARARDYPHQFSGGMKQRAVIAMALACSPDILIADEPTTALDVMVQAQILDLLAELRDRLGLAVILVTHDLGVVAELCDTVLVMYAGVVAEHAPADAVYNAPQHPYTKQLLEAFPSVATRSQRLASISGSPPPLDNLPPGCRFAPRCPFVFDRCRAEPPPLYIAEKGHAARCFLLDTNSDVEQHR